jgi:hypothetical protein
MTNSNGRRRDGGTRAMSSSAQEPAVPANDDALFDVGFELMMAFDEFLVVRGILEVESREPKTYCIEEIERRKDQRVY